MDLACPSCAVSTSVPDDRLPPEGARARCHSCGCVAIYYRGGLVADDPTPPQGLDAGATQVLPQPAAPSEQEPDWPAGSLPSIGLASPARAPEPAPPPASPSGPATSIGWQLRTSAGDQGPLALDALRPLIRDGRLRPDDLACPPGAAAWTRAGDCAELKRWFALQGKSGKAPAPEARDHAPCSQHPAARGRWMCQACGNLACDACVIRAEVARVDVQQCPACRKVCTELVPTRKITPFWEEIPGLLAYPVKGLGWLGLIIFPMLGMFYGLAMFTQRGPFLRVSLYGLVGGLITLMIILSYHLYIIRDTTKGGRSLPNLGNVGDVLNELFWPAVKAFFVSCLLFLPTTWAGARVTTAGWELQIAEATRDALVEEKKQAEARAADPDWRDDEESDEERDPNAAALDQALASIGGGDLGGFGGGMGDSLGSAFARERDLDAEIRDAEAAIREAKARVRSKQAIRAALTVVALGAWPITLIVIALFNTILPVFQPDVLGRIVREVPKAYGWCMVISLTCFLCAWLANLPFRNTFVLNNIYASPVTYYFSFIAFHVMGRTAELAEREIDWH